MSIIQSNKGMSVSKGGSAMQNTSVGSGSRPTKSSIKIETSEPTNAYTLDRDPPSKYLK